MKKIYLSGLALTMLAFAGNAQYCTGGGPTSTGDTNVEGVTLTGEAGGIAYTGCPGVTGVEDQTAQSVDLAAGSSYSIDVTWGTCGGNYGNVGEVWIDYNGDEVFDPSESIGTVNYGGGTNLQSYPFTVPGGAALGNTRMRIMQQESGGLPLDPCAGFTWGSVADFTINIVAPVSCPGVTNLSVNSADETTADIGWDNPGGVPEWQVEYGAPGFTPGTGAGTQSIVVTNAANLTGLTSNSFYDVYVRAICTPGADTSGWTSAVTFNTYNQGAFMIWDTDCGPGFNDISGTGTSYAIGDEDDFSEALPFPFLYQGMLMSDVSVDDNGALAFGTSNTIGFTNGSMNTAQTGLYPFWDDLHTGDIYTETVGTAPNRQYIIQWHTRTAYFEVAGQDVTFQVVLDEATNEIYFLYQDVEFGGSQSGDDFGALATIGAAGPNQDIDVSVDNGDFLMNNSCIHFFYTNCPPPTNLAITDFTPDSLMFSWNAGGTETDWDVVWGPEGFSAPDGGTMFSTTDMADTIGMLTQLTTYDIYVRASCGGGTDSSIWVGPLTQMTAPVCPNPSGLTLDGQNVDSAFVSWTSNGTETDWNLQYGLAGFEIGSGMTQASTTIPDTITGLMGSMVYDIYVQSNCGGADTSLWIGPVQVAVDIINDSTCDAIDLTVDGNPVWFHNNGATEQIGETANLQPNLTGYNTQDGWGDGGIALSTWFTFTAPASGIVEISGRDENYNGQIAVYEATDCSDLSTFTMIGANDDGYTGFGGVELTLCGLTPGNTYYLLHDDSPFTGAGIFSLSVAEVSQPEAGTATDMSACAGEIVNLNDHLAGNEEGTWTSLDNPSFVANDSLFPFTDLLAYGDYTFQYTVNKRCAMDSAILVVTTVGPSSAGIDTTLVDGCFHAPVNLFDGLTGNVDLGGTWYDATDNALAGNSVPGGTYSLPGAYNFSYIVSNGVCPADTAEITVVYQDCLGLDAFEIGNVDVYPNPTNGIFNIANNGNLSDFEIVITDMTGKTIYNNTSSLANGAVETIDLTSYEKGIYMVSLTSEGKTNQYKVVLQ